MIESTRHEVHCFQFQAFARHDRTLHAITGRHADIGRHPHGLNLSFATAEHPSEVIAAREDVCQALGLRLADFVVPDQTHGTRVAVVGAHDRGRGAFQRESSIHDCDGMTTSEPGVVLFVTAADCVPLIFYDPVRHAIGVAHAGWRGTLARIGSAVVAAMSLHWGSRATDLLVGIGPSIGPCCYAVGDDVVLATTVAFTDESALITHRSCQSYLDLWRANRIALEHSGVRCENIHVAGLCTACRPDLFFSHRAEQGRAGRFAAVIKLLNGET